MNKKMTFKCQILKFHDIHLANGFCLISPTNLYEKANNSLRIIDNIKKKKCTHEKKKTNLIRFSWIHIASFIIMKIYIYYQINTKNKIKI